MDRKLEEDELYLQNLLERGNGNKSMEDLFILV